MPETKHLPYFELKSDKSSRERTGICAIFGNVDDWGDRIQPGAFAKTISEGRNRVRHLWMHDSSKVPTAVITDLKELTRDELPPEVLEYAPEATGGLQVTRKYLNNQNANDVLEALDAGAIKEMSFAFEPVRSGETVEGEGNNKRYIRELYEVKMFDTSDVNWGMNNATTIKGKADLPPLSVVGMHLKLYAEEFKSGRRNSEGDQLIINAIHDLSAQMGAVCESNPTDETNSEEKNAEAALTSTSLSDLKLGFQKLKLGNLTL